MDRQQTRPNFQDQRQGARFGQHNGDFVGFARNRSGYTPPDSSSQNENTSGLHKGRQSESTASRSIFSPRPDAARDGSYTQAPARATERNTNSPAASTDANPERSDSWSIASRRPPSERAARTQEDSSSRTFGERNGNFTSDRRVTPRADIPTASATKQRVEEPQEVDSTVLDKADADVEDRPRRERKSRRSVSAEDFDDAPSKRRQKDDKTNRRAEKFASAEDEDEDFMQAQAEKEERERKKKEKKEKKERKEAAKQALKKIELPPFISVGNLATALKVRSEEFAQKLQEFGFEEINSEHVLSFENASLIANEYGYDPTVDRSEVADLKPRPPPLDVTALPSRPPVVTIMGHVDHGKTTLLDYMRKSSVAATEHGGITQHIGAFSVSMSSGSLITFLDTPGHAAFLSMRQRGANVTDIVILVVAADDSVKPQTIEAIKHAKNAKVPIIVAINKIDKDEADIESVKQDLSLHDVEVEDFGGDIQAIPVSGRTGEGLDKLEEAIVTQAEILDMRAEKDGAAEGWVLEATTKRAGRVATVLVRRGTLRPGDVIVAGTTWARVRTLKNEAGVTVDEAGPGTPVEVDGWRDQAMAGDEVIQAPSEQRASSVVEYRESRLEQDQAAKDMEAINENRRRETEKHEMEKAAKEEVVRKATEAGERYKHRGKSLTNADYVPKDPSKIELFIIVKADVSGSAEAIEGSLNALPLHNQPVSLNVLRVGVGPVSEFDLDHISAVPDGQGFIVSFNQELPAHIRGEADKFGIRILDENIIYKVIDDVRAAVEAKLPPLITRRVTGEAEAAQVFEINTGGRKTTKVAGCKIRNGSVTKGGKVSVYRGTVGDPKALVYEGTISSLKSQKKDVQEMRKGTECGISFDDWTDFKAGDLLSCYEEKKEARRLI